MTIKYKIQSASEENICQHLFACNHNFIPPLESVVNIKNYSAKIKDNGITVEAWSGSRLVGMIAVYLNDFESRMGYITNVSVMSDYSGQGIASRLLNNCIELVKERSFNSILLEVNEKNKSAVGLYVKFNFRKVSEPSKENFIKMKLDLSGNPNSK